MRVCHSIKKNHRSETPSSAIWLAMRLDENTALDGDMLYSVNSFVAIRGRKDSRTGQWSKELVFREDVLDFWQLLDEWTLCKTKTYVLVHDSHYFLILFDVLNLAPVMGWTIGKAILNCPPCILTLKNGNRSIEILDIQNIWPTLSWPYLNGKNELPGPSESGEDGPFCEISELLERAESMSKKCQDWWQFLRTHDLGGFSATIGSQSLRVWRHRFISHQVVIDCHDESLALARKAVYGGRCECFHVGKFSGNFYQLDINACYPFIMSSSRMPTRIRFWTTHGNIGDVEKWQSQSVCVAHVAIRTDIPVYPLRSEGMLLFPTGTFKTVLAGVELEYAIARGHVLEIEKLAIYEGEDAFKDYMNALWAMRLNAKDRNDADDAEKWKLLMNSFWGRWAQHGGQWELVDRTSDYSMRSWTELDYDTQETRHFRQFGGILQEKSQETEAPESHPAIAAAVTAGARQLLWQYIQCAGIENVFYCDTDSILVNAMGYRRLFEHIDERVMGKLKVQGIYETCEILNAKHYRLGHHEKSSGKPAQAVDNGQGAMDFMLKPHLDEQIRCNGKIRAVGLWVRKHWNERYKKGVVMEDGKVIPFVK